MLIFSRYGPKTDFHLSKCRRSSDELGKFSYVGWIDMKKKEKKNFLPHYFISNRQWWMTPLGGVHHEMKVRFVSSHNMISLNDQDLRTKTLQPHQDPIFYHFTLTQQWRSKAIAPHLGSDIWSINQYVRNEVQTAHKLNTLSNDVGRSGTSSPTTRLRSIFNF